MNTSCGVIITDGVKLLLCHATGTPRWDIPKGLADEGEQFIDAAVREVFEETGLLLRVSNLKSLGVFPYTKGKNLALFLYKVELLPDVSVLDCDSYFEKNGKQIPEVDKYDLFTFDEAVSLTGKKLGVILADIKTRGMLD